MTDDRIDLSRYDRQIRFAAIGPQGQRQLANSRALIVGVGALGSTAAELLARAGVGHLRIVDRDFLELTNLQRQSLYSEADVAAELPKAIAAANRLRAINSSLKIEPFVADVTPQSLGRLADSMQILIDGTDNFETRFLLNDYSLKYRVPWVYGGCLGCDGQTMTIVPGQTACFRCLMPDGPPPATEMPTCDTAGILGPMINVIAAIQSLEAIKILSGNQAAIQSRLQVFSLWENRIQQVDLAKLTELNSCPACRGQRYEWLDGTRGSQTAILCGRNAVQIRPDTPTTPDFPLLATRLAGLGTVQSTPYFVRLTTSDWQLTVFADARAIIAGTQDLMLAKKIYTQCLGN